MDVKIEKKEKNIVRLEITVEAEKFNEALRKSYFKNAKKFNIPGFRKGKAPMSIIKRYYGEGVFYEDAINFCCDDTYPKAIKENDIKVVDYPQIDIVQIGEGKDFIYSAEVAVYPEVTLGEYNGVEVKKVEYNVTDEDVENKLKQVQDQNSRIEEKNDGEIENGDIVTIDFKGFIEGEAFEGGEASDYELEVGSKSFIDTFEEQLIGMKVGDSKEINVTFPEEYGREDLNGKPAVFKVTVKGIKRKELPALDDEFAKEVSEFDTLEEYKNDIRKNIQEANEAKAKREYEEAVIDAVCANAEVDIPEAMINKEIDYMIKDLEMRLKYQGLDLKIYYAFTNTSEEKVREYMKENAEKKVKTEVVLDAIANKENIEVSDEEILDKAKEIAKMYGDKEIDKAAEMIAKSQRELLKTDVINEKVVEMLVKNSKTIA
ncbi:trigger factor [Clostridium tepidiprofundi DSM 19306]|uniref:Trigger factor n=1 Tax=Clostridium tepidiprofundi DSM 19306 TaxID=1121338 RepID=A0A151AUX5_9CLOT|nr:trigger factor [Clostridium tepidiprofundi]KYH31474.1 trigger factor [Clostridium tepidiprofundi DSM 19306]